MSAERNVLVFLDNISESIEAVFSYVGDMSFDEYDSQELIQDAVNMRLQIIGENVNKLPVGLRDAFPNIAWYKIRGLRNIISHDYSILDCRIIWNIIKDELPALHGELSNLQQAATEY